MKKVWGPWWEKEEQERKGGRWGRERERKSFKLNGWVAGGAIFSILPLSISSTLCSTPTPPPSHPLPLLCQSVHSLLGLIEWHTCKHWHKNNRHRLPIETCEAIWSFFGCTCLFSRYTLLNSLPHNCMLGNFLIQLDMYLIPAHHAAAVVARQNQFPLCHWFYEVSAFVFISNLQLGSCELSDVKLLMCR